MRTLDYGVVGFVDAGRNPDNLWKRTAGETTLNRFRSSLMANVVRQSAGLVALILSPFPALATPFSMDQFERLGSEYSFSVPLSLAGGHLTDLSYSGYVEVLVSGVGAGAPDENGMVDAFYTVDRVTDASRGLNSNTLRVGSETMLQSLPSGASFLPLDSRHFEAGSVHVAGLAVAYVGNSFAVAGYDPLDINSGFAPVYNFEHVYNFVIDLGAYSGRLALGIGDGGTHDNSGNYAVSIWQAGLKNVAPVPEPGTLGLLGAGLLAMCVRRRRTG